MTNLDQEKFARQLIEFVTQYPRDKDEIRKRALFLAQVLDCRNAKTMSTAELAEILGFSRQYAYREVDTLTSKIAELRRILHESSSAKLAVTSQASPGQLNSWSSKN